MGEERSIISNGSSRGRRHGLLTQIRNTSLFQYSKIHLKCACVPDWWRHSIIFTYGCSGIETGFSGSCHTVVDSLRKGVPRIIHSIYVQSEPNLQRTRNERFKFIFFYRNICQLELYRLIELSNLSNVSLFRFSVRKPERHRKEGS